MKANCLMNENCCALIISILKNKTRNDAFKALGLSCPLENADYKKDSRKIPHEDREKIYKLYHEDKLNMRDIAEIYKTSAVSVGNYFKTVGIPSRSKSESKRVMSCKGVN